LGGFDKALEDYTRKLHRAARDRTLALAFLKGADRKLYGTLWIELENQFTRQHDQYPHDLTAAYNLLLNYKPTTRARYDADDDVNGLTFTQRGGVTTPGTNGVTHERVTCFTCNHNGHYASDCPDAPPGEDPAPEVPAIQMLQMNEVEDDDEDIDDGNASEFMFTQAHGLIPSNWVLLDSQSTVSVFCNKKYLTNVRNAGKKLTVHTNGGTQVSTLVGDTSFGTVWYNPHSLANILSMAAVRKQCRITMDTSVEAAMCVHRADGSVMKFTEFASGLYFYDVETKSTNSTVSNYSHHSHVQTVRDNKANFTKREIQGADDARRLQRLIGRHSDREFEDILDNNRITNCPLTSKDAKRALAIYGTDEKILEGKTRKKKKSKHVVSFEAIPIPSAIANDHEDVTLCADIFYVNKEKYFHTISRKIKFRTVAPIKSRHQTVLLKETNAIKNLYETRGFKVVDLHVDNEFACIREDIRPTNLNVANADDHVPEIERSIQTVKERTRCLANSLPYKRYPKLLSRSMVENAIKGLNDFPAKDGISTTISPKTIVTGAPAPDYNDMKLEFGTYVHVYEDHTIKNDMKARTTPAITLNRTDNQQGGYYFMSLVTGDRLSRRQWTVVPMSDDVITAVEAMATKQKQPLMVNGPIFEWSPGRPIDDMPVEAAIARYERANTIDDDEEIIPTPDQETDAEEADSSDAVDENEEEVSDDNTDTSISEHDDTDDDLSYDESSHDDITGDTDDGINNSIEVEEAENDDELPEIHDDAIDMFGDDNDDDDVELRSEHDADVEQRSESDDDVEQRSELDDAGDDPTPETGRYNLRGSRERSYDHRFTNVMDNPASTKSYDIQLLQKAVENLVDGEVPIDLQHYVTGFIMTQMTATAGIKKHGEKAVNALLMEFCQLDDKEVFKGLMASELTSSQRKEALRAVNLIKEKRDGKLKGRTCADGRSQRSLYTKEETSSPTVSTDALMMSMVIDAKEKRDVATADVVGAYLNADMPDFVVLKLVGSAVDIMCMVNPKYKKFVTHENGKRVLYLQLLKALYGCVQSALLWYDLFTNTLKDDGFELNPYDACVANKIVNGKQCTIVWYVDDNKISHVEAAVVTEVVKMIEKRFGKMTVTRGKHHVFLGMSVTYKDDGTVQIIMKDHLQSAITVFDDDITTSVTSPAQRDLFEVDNTREKLSIEKSENYHKVVAKLLHVSKRARLDIQLPVSFLCTRVSCSDISDWRKLKRVLQYLRGTLDDVLILGADDITIISTWVDASYAVHADMKSHTGGVISFGRGGLFTKSTKQKLNTKSSTEAELVGASDYLPNTIWAMLFLKAQGYEMKESKFYQDNQSTMKLEINGKRSSGQKTRHIDIRYFFIKDRIKTEGIDIVHCPTLEMLGDFYTKPLQGSLFRKFREVIMGRKHIDSLKDPSSSPSQERVGTDLLVKNGSGDNDIIAGKDRNVDPSEPQDSYASVVRRKTDRRTDKCESHSSHTFN
jgi:hypothetical protein